MNKSYVTLETHSCPVCGKEHETNNLLLNKRLRNVFDKKTLTGFSFCENCNKLKNDGYLALVEIDDSQTIKEKNGNILPQNAYRTGQICHVKKSAASVIFDINIDPNLNMIYVEIGVIEKIQAMTSNEKKNI